MLRKIIFFKIVLITFVIIVTYLMFPESSQAMSSIDSEIDHSDDVGNLYKTNCAECHNADRLGGMGPALLPENLKRLRKKSAIDVITNGRVATQMLAFKEKLNDKQIQSLVDYIYTPLKETPTWGIDEIRNSQIIHNKEEDLPNKPVFHVDDLLNLFLVVELGDHHVTLLDGDKFEPITVLNHASRFMVARNIHPMDVLSISPHVTDGSASTISIT